MLSPLLFILYMGKCLRSICGGRTDVETFAYADDVAVIADTAEQLHELKRWNTGLERNGLKMNKNKAEVMHVGRRREDLNISVREQQLNQVENFKYLGVNFNEGNDQEVEINRKIAKYNANVSVLYPILRDKNVPRKCNVTIYKTILKPVLM